MIPTPHTLQVKRYDPEAGTDGHGNTVPGYAAPVDWPVHGLAPGSVAEQNGLGQPDPRRDLSLIVWTVYAPADDKSPADADLVLVDGDEFEVSMPQDWSRGPWLFPSAGVAVELKRPEG